MPLIVGPDFRDAAIAPVPWNDPGKVEVSRLRVAFYPEMGSRRPRPKQKETVQGAAKFLEEAGCPVKGDLPKSILMEMEEVRFKVAPGRCLVRAQAPGRQMGHQSPFTHHR